MPDICTASTSPNTCGHHILTIGGRTFHVDPSELLPLSDAEKETLFRLAVRHKGIALAQLLNRVVIGDEATNVKPYSFLGPGASVVLTNMRGVAANTWQNLLTGLNGERILADFTGATKFRPFANGVFPGTGPHGIRILRSPDNEILYSNANIAAQAGERELDPGWLDVPAGFTGEHLLIVQVTSATQTDDPTYRRVGLLVK